MQDIATSDGFNSQNNSLTVFLGNGFTFNPPVSFDAGENLRGLSLADINFDGIQDIVGFSLTNLLLIGGSTKIERKTLTQSFTYDPTFSQLTTFTDEEGRTYTYTIDPANGNVLRVDGPLGYSMRYTYTPDGLLDTETDALDRVTDYDYDALGRLTQIIFAMCTVDQAIVQYTYDAAGNVASFTDENNNVTSFEYDDLNRLVLERDPLLDETTYSYDPNGNLLTVTDALNRITTFTYDSMDRLQTVADPIANTTTYSYDIAGNLIAVTDPLLHTTQHRYDAANRRIRTIDPAGGMTDFRYDRSNNLTAVLDQSRNITLFFYDERERLTREIDPLSKSSFYLYDGVNNLIRSRDRLNRQIDYQYDPLDRVVEENWLDPLNLNLVHSLTFSYDLMDNLLTAQDATSSLTYDYDHRNRVLSADNVGTPGIQQVKVEYQYDDVGNVTHVMDMIDGAFGGITGYDYDPLNRVSRIIQMSVGFNDKRADFEYNAIGQTESITRFSDLAGTQKVATTTYGFDTANRLSNITHKDATDAVFAFYDYGYDAASRITSINDVDGPTTYNYDSRNQLTGADRNAGDARGDEQYAFDATGNRTDSHLHGANYDTTKGNRLSSDGTFTYQYDAEGNLVTRTEVATGSVRRFQWDYRNRLVQMTDENSSGVALQIVTYVYDALDRRISKNVDATPNDTADGVVTQFIYDREDIILDIVDADGDGVGLPVVERRYLHGPGIDSVLSQDDGSQSEWLFVDHLGTIRDIRTDGGQLNHITFDSFGSILSQTNATLDSRYGFTGREFDAESGLQYFRARYLDTTNGRFVSEDPIGLNDGPNKSIYVSNSPLIANDPYGEAAAQIAAVVAIATILGAETIFFYDNAMNPPPLPLPPYIPPTPPTRCTASNPFGRLPGPVIRAPRPGELNYQPHEPMINPFTQMPGSTGEEGIKERIDLPRLKRQLEEQRRRERQQGSIQNLLDNYAKNNRRKQNQKLNRINMQRVRK
ncbi:MAG: RHS repeat-associated core domain-containing protein [Flavobacteriaceae bacterium]|nr:RHS repeat-associated core domain-containing protein [Flavobacteriaceae bacterium]